MGDKVTQKDSSGRAVGFKGSEAGKSYDDIESKAERERYRKSKGFSGLGGAAKMKKPDFDAENSYMETWRKNRAQKAAVAEAAKK